MNRKGSAPLIVLLVLVTVLVVGGAYFYFHRSAPKEVVQTSAVTINNPEPQNVTLPALTQLIDWGSYQESSSFVLILRQNQDCNPPDSQFAAYLDQVNASGTVLGKMIDDDLILYSPNVYHWTSAQVMEKSSGSFCEAGNPMLYYAYPDKLVWGFGCGGGVDPACSQADSAILNYFSNLPSSTAAN